MIAQWVYHDYEIWLYSTNSTQEYAVQRMKVDYCILSRYGFFIIRFRVYWFTFFLQRYTLCIPGKSILRLQEAIRFSTPRVHSWSAQQTGLIFYMNIFTWYFYFNRHVYGKNSSSFRCTRVIRFIRMQRMKYPLRVS